MTLPPPAQQDTVSVPPQPPAPQVVPSGFRQGIITAITVLLGFSLAFWRFWGLEAPGRWGTLAILAAAALLIAVALQIVALFRALRIEDDAVAEYRQTVRWFIGSAVALLVGLAVAMVDAAL